MERQTGSLGRAAALSIVLAGVSFLSAPALAQEELREAERLESEIQETFEDAAAATTDFERIQRLTSVRVPDEMLEVAPAEEHRDLVLRNRFITRFRARVLQRPPEARVRAVTEILDELTDSGAISPLDALPLEQGMLILVADKPVFAIVREDLDPLAGETLETRADAAVANLEIALAEMVELRDPQKLIRSVVATSTALAIFLLVAWLLQRIKRWVHGRFLTDLDQRMQTSIAKRIGSAAQYGIRFLTLFERLLVLLLWTLFLLVGYAWLTFSLEQFPYTRPWGETLGETLVDLLGWVANGIAQAIPGLLVVLFIIILARTGSRLVRTLFAGVEGGRIEIPGLHPETAPPTRRLVNTAIWLVAIVVAYPYFPGSSTAAFKGLSVFLGLVISLGSTGIVNQAMSGLMLMYSRALRPGDFVQIGEVQGTVTHLGMLSTKIRSLRNEEITVPNAVVIAKETTNYTRHQAEGVALSTAVTIGYDTPWRTVHRLLVEAAVRTEGLRQSPEPFVLQTALGDFYPEYKLVAVIDRPEKRGRVLSELHQHIQDLFHENGIQIMSPHYESDPERPLIPDLS